MLTHSGSRSLLMAHPCSHKTKILAHVRSTKRHGLTDRSTTKITSSDTYVRTSKRDWWKFKEIPLLGGGCSTTKMDQSVASSRLRRAHYVHDVVCIFESVINISLSTFHLWNPILPETNDSAAQHTHTQWAKPQGNISSCNKNWKTSQINIVMHNPFWFWRWKHFWQTFSSLWNKTIVWLNFS